jgi:LytS/YehU family sensor histidine kinase
MVKFLKSTLEFLIRTSRDVLIVLAIGLTISLIFSWGSILKSADGFIRSAIYSLVIGFSIWKTNELYSRILEKFHPWHVRPKLTLFLDLIGTVVISCLVIFLVNYYLYFLISNKHFSERPQYFILVGIIQLFISLVITSVFYISRFFKEWRKLLLNEEVLKREALASQYEALKSYVNPHFLFNSLSVLDALIDANPLKAKAFIMRFSDVYRYVLQQKDKELVTLAEELEFAKSYIYLNKIRHGDALQVDIDVENQHGMVIPVSLQILLENAFKHNEASMENPLHVKISRQGDELVVINNYQPRKVVIDHPGIGLNTIDRRMEQFGNRNIRISNDGKFFQVSLPILPLFP